MKPGKLDGLLQLARQTPPSDSGNAPPFFAQRVAARWLSAQRERERSPWEIFALRGVALSATAMFLAAVVNALPLRGNNDEGDPDYTAEVFSLP
jgi:hypothetical protein